MFNLPIAGFRKSGAGTGLRRSRAIEFRETMPNRRKTTVTELGRTMTCPRTVPLVLPKPNNAP